MRGVLNRIIAGFGVPRSTEATMHLDSRRRQGVQESNLFTPLIVVSDAPDAAYVVMSHL